MLTFLPYVYCYMGGAATVGAWWFWQSRKDKIKQVVRTVENIAK